MFAFQMGLLGVSELAQEYADLLSDSSVRSAFRYGGQLIAQDAKRGHEFKNRTGRFESSFSAWDSGSGVMVGPRPEVFAFDGVVFYPVYVAGRGLYNLEEFSRRGIDAIEKTLAGQDAGYGTAIVGRPQPVFGADRDTIRMGVFVSGR